MRLTFCALSLILCEMSAGISPGAHAAREIPISITPCGYGGGGRFTAVAVDPSDPNTILVGSDVAGVFKSTDGGGHFRLAGSGLESFAVASIAFAPSPSNLLFLLAWDGFYLSTDRGEKWIKKSSDIRYRQRYSGSNLFAVAGKTLFIATDTGTIFTTSPDNATASPVPLPAALPVPALAIASSREKIYAATGSGVFCYGAGFWQNLSDGLPPTNRAIVDIAALPDGTLYALEETTGVYRLDPGKAQWQAVARPESGQLPLFDRSRRYKAFAADPGPPVVLFLATHPETWPHMLFRSTDRGSTWTCLTRFFRACDATPNWPAASSITAVEQLRCAGIPGLVYMSDWWNVWKSTDAGMTWQQLHRGLQNTVVNDIKTDPRRPGVIYMAVGDNGLMMSSDYGKTWERKMNGVVDGHAQEIEVSCTNPSLMYLLMNPWEKKHRVYVYRSQDGGNRWQDVGFPLPDVSLPALGYVDGAATNLELDPYNDSVVYVATNGYGVFKTTDAGSTWTPINTGLTTPYIRGPRALLVHPQNSSVLFVSTQAGGLYTSTDAGQTWRHVRTGHNFTFGMAIDPTDPSRMFVCCPEKRIIRTSDGGTTWSESRLPGPTPPNIAAYAIALHPKNPSIVFVGTLSYDYTAADGLFVSRDGGKTFFRCAINLPRVNLNVIHCTDNTAGDLLLGFNGIGLFRGSFLKAEAP